MKKIIFSLFTLILLSATIFISCSKDESTGDGTVTPTIFFKKAPTYVSSNMSMLSKEWFKVGITALANKNSQSPLAKIEVYSTVTNMIPVLETSIVLPEGDLSVQGYDKEWGFYATDLGGMQKWEFKVTDVNGMSSSVTFNITTPIIDTTGGGGGTDPSTPFGSPRSGSIYNLAAASTYGVAFDLVNNVTKLTTDPDAVKDMCNTTVVASAPAPYAFQNEWIAKNTTKFVDVTAAGFDYLAPTFGTAKAAFEAGTQTSTITGVLANRMYVAKLRGLDEYAVIKISSVDLTTSDNLDKINFTYKKIN